MIGAQAQLEQLERRSLPAVTTGMIVGSVFVDASKDFGVVA